MAQASGPKGSFDDAIMQAMMQKSGQPPEGSPEEEAGESPSEEEAEEGSPQEEAQESPEEEAAEQQSGEGDQSTPDVAIQAAAQIAMAILQHAGGGSNSSGQPPIGDV